LGGLQERAGFVLGERMNLFGSGSRRLHGSSVSGNQAIGERLRERLVERGVDLANCGRGEPRVELLAIEPPYMRRSKLLKANMP